MGNGLTRTFDATYTSKDKKKHKLNVRVYRRLGTFGLSIGLIRNEQTYSLSTDENTQKKTLQLDGQDLTRDLELIESIIDKNNDVVQSLDSRENKIANLESYFYDYLLNSTAANIAKSSSKSNREQSKFYKSVLFGTPKNSKEADENSIYGAYIGAYLKYHEKKEHTDEEKNAYLTSLNTLEKRTNEDLNLGGSIRVVVPYSDYRAYLEHKTTAQNEEKLESFI